jgi:hypothetical protein
MCISDNSIIVDQISWVLTFICIFRGIKIFGARKQSLIDRVLHKAVPVP